LSRKAGPPASGIHKEDTMDKIEKIGGVAADCYLHEGSAIRLMEANQYQEFLSRQCREVMRNCGTINPEDIDAYIRNGGFNALTAAVTAMTPEKVVEQMKKAALRDRSAEGRFTGESWEAYRQVQHLPHYVVSTRLGGFSEAWMERTLLEGNPFALIEGMAIAAYALGGVGQGIIYLPSAYKPLAFRRMSRAIHVAQARRYIGRNILAMPFNFDIEIREAMGEDQLSKANNPFVCGECARSLFDFEETTKYANFKNVEFWPKPFYTNNVETYMNIPLLLNKGADSFASLGTKNATGTKIFALTGKTRHPCLVEAPLGSTLAQLLEMADGKASSLQGELKAFQLGGSSGGIFFLGLGITFALLALLPTSGGQMRWAWIPAGILGLMGILIIFAAENLINYIWPSALILAGILLVGRSFRK